MKGTSEIEPAYGRVYLHGYNYKKGSTGAYRGKIWAPGVIRALDSGALLWADDQTHDPDTAFERMKAAADKLNERPIKLYRSTDKNPHVVIV